MSCWTFPSLTALSLEMQFFFFYCSFTILLVKRYLFVEAIFLFLMDLFIKTLCLKNVTYNNTFLLLFSWAPSVLFCFVFFQAILGLWLICNTINQINHFILPRTAVTGAAVNRRCNNRFMHFSYNESKQNCKTSFCINRTFLLYSSKKKIDDWQDI